MAKKIASILTLVSFLTFCIGCSSSGLRAGESGIQTDPEKEYISKRMPRVFITAASLDHTEARLISLQGNTLRVRPYPLVGLNLLKVDIEDIVSIEHKPGKIAPWLAIGSGFVSSALTFTIFFKSMSNKEASNNNGFAQLFEVIGALLLGIGLTAMAFPVGMIGGSLIGKSIDDSGQQVFDFRGLSASERKTILRKLMKV